MMTYAPLGWGIALVLSYSYLTNTLPDSETPLGDELFWVMPVFYVINGIALLLARYVSTLPGRFLPFPYKHYWLANPQRQGRYFRVCLTVSWVVTGLVNLGLASLVHGLMSTGSGTALGAIGFLGLDIIAFCFALFWPTKMLKPAATSHGSGRTSGSGRMQSYVKREFK